MLERFVWALAGPTGVSPLGLSGDSIPSTSSSPSPMLSYSECAEQQLGSSPTRSQLSEPESDGYRIEVLHIAYLEVSTRRFGAGGRWGARLGSS